MIAILETKLGDHVKKHWGKYALIGGGLLAAGFGKGLENSALRHFDLETSRLGDRIQSYGHGAIGGGIALGVKDDIDNIKNSSKKK